MQMKPEYMYYCSKLLGELYSVLTVGLDLGHKSCISSVLRSSQSLGNPNPDDLSSAILSRWFWRSKQPIRMTSLGDLIHFVFKSYVLLALMSG